MLVEKEQQTPVPPQYLVLIPEQMDVLLEGASEVGSPCMVRGESLGRLKLKIEGLLWFYQAKAQLGSFKLLQVLHKW